MRRYLFPLVLLCLSVPTFGQVWSGVLAPSRAVDWSTAGVSGGIINRTNICQTLSPGATASQISAAIASCSSGGVVFLNAGTYNLNAGIVFNAQSNVTLRGAGANQTFLVFTGGNGCHGVWADICMDSTDTNWPGGPANTASWTAGYTKGTTTITLSGHTNLTVGQPLILDQADDAADTGSKFVCQSTSLCSLEGNSNNGARSNRDQAQIVQVASCGASAPGAACTSNTIIITPGLYADNWNSGKSPGAWWSSGPISAAGVENLSLDNTNSSGNNGFSVWNCQDCWIKGVRSINAGRSHVEVWLSNRVTVRDSYFYGGQGSSSQSYGISPYGSTALLAENNIFQRVTLPLQMNGCAGCVLGYNYAINDYYTPSAGYVNPMIMWHTAGDDLDLAEGNVGAQTYADVFHGTHNLITFFRNQFTGNEPACSNGGSGFQSCTGHQVPMDIQSYNREFNVIGNVLGQAGLQSGYESGNPIFDLGSGNSEGSVTVRSDSLVKTTIMRWGNYDTVNGAPRFVSTEVPSGLSSYANPVPANNNLPASFYYSSTPGWWPASKSWPPIGPDVTGGNVSGVDGHAYTIPAQDCYSTTMRGSVDGTGSVLSFNAASCYTSSGGGGGSAPPPPSAPEPPTNLTGVVH